MATLYTPEQIAQALTDHAEQKARHRVAQRLYYQRKKEERRQYQRAYYATHREEVIDRDKRNYHQLRNMLQVVNAEANA